MIQKHYKKITVVLGLHCRINSKNENKCWSIILKINILDRIFEFKI